MADLKHETKAVARHSSVYMIGTILNRIVAFLMIPIYTRYLSPANYGTVEILSLTTDVIGMLISIGIASAMYRFYFDYRSEEERNEVISTAILTFGTIALVCLAFVAMFSPYMADYLFNSSRLYFYFLITFTSLWFNTLCQMGYDYLRMKERSVKYIVYSASRLALSLSLNIYLVVVVKLGVLGVLLSTLFSSITITCVLVVPMLVQIKIRFSLSKCKEMLKYGAPLIPTNIAAFIVHASDRFFVNRFAGLAETGIYSLAYKFGNLPNNFIAAPFMQIWEVRFFQSYKDKNAHILFGTLFTYLCFFLFFAGLGISVCIKGVLMIIADPSYWTAYQVVPIVIICYIVFSFQYVFNMSIYFEKKTHYLAYINGSNAVLNIILNFILIGYLRLGMWGAAFATLICFVYKAIATYTVGNKLYKIHLETARIIKMVCAAFCIYGVCTLVSFDFVLVNLAVKALLVLTFPLLLYLFRFYTPEELAAIKAFLRSPQLAVAALVRR